MGGGSSKIAANEPVEVRDAEVDRIKWANEALIASRVAESSHHLAWHLEVSFKLESVQTRADELLRINEALLKSSEKRWSATKLPASQQTERERLSREIAALRRAEDLVTGCAQRLDPMADDLRRLVREYEASLGAVENQRQEQPRGLSIARAAKKVGAFGGAGTAGGDGGGSGAGGAGAVGGGGSSSGAPLPARRVEASHSELRPFSGGQAASVPRLPCRSDSPPSTSSASSSSSSTGASMVAVAALSSQSMPRGSGAPAQAPTRPETPTGGGGCGGSAGGGGASEALPRPAGPPPQAATTVNGGGGGGGGGGAPAQPRPVANGGGVPAAQVAAPISYAGETRVDGMTMQQWEESLKSQLSSDALTA